MKKNKQYYTLNDVEEYVNRLMSESEKIKSVQAQKIEELEREKKQLSKTVDEFKQKEKTINRTLVLAERRAEYILNNTRTRAMIELNRLTEFSVKWEKFFDALDKKYDAKDRESFEEFNKELRNILSSFTDFSDSLDGTKPLSGIEKTYIEETARIKHKTRNDLDERFAKLLHTFNEKLGEPSAKVQVKEQKPLRPVGASSVYPPKGDSGFDFEEALNPTDTLEDIMRDLLSSKKD